MFESHHPDFFVSSEAIGNSPAFCLLSWGCSYQSVCEQCAVRAARLRLRDTSNRPLPSYHWYLEQFNAVDYLEIRKYYLVRL